jgi:hypothetical protein
MNLIEEINNDDQILRALYNSLQIVATEIEKKQYFDLEINSSVDFYNAVKIAADLLIKNDI